MNVLQSRKETMGLLGKMFGDHSLKYEDDF